MRITGFAALGFILAGALALTTAPHAAAAPMVATSHSPLQQQASVRPLSIVETQRIAADGWLGSIVGAIVGGVAGAAQGGVIGAIAGAILGAIAGSADYVCIEGPERGHCAPI